MTKPALELLWDKIDAFFARVGARYPGELACRAGCHDCCDRRLTVTEVEADVIRRALSELDADARARLAERARTPGAKCPVLEPDGRCAIYAARPVVCRSHGLPIRFAPEEAPEGRRSLPVVDACFKNFSGRDVATLDPDTILDQTTLSTLLAAVDAAHTDASSLPRGGRVDLASLLV